MTTPAGAARWAAIGAAGLLVVSGIAALVVRDDGNGDGRQVATDAGTSTTEDTTTTTTTTMAASTTTSSIEVSILKITSTTTTAKPAAATTSSTRAPVRTFTISPTSGPGHTEVRARGAGCTGQDAGVGLTLHAPSGKAFDGTGAAAMPDGTWDIPIRVSPNEGPGRYKIAASCTVGPEPSFTYAPQYFTVTG